MTIANENSIFDFLEKLCDEIDQRGVKSDSIRASFARGTQGVEIDAIALKLSRAIADAKRCFFDPSVDDDGGEDMIAWLQNLITRCRDPHVFSALAGGDDDGCGFMLNQVERLMYRAKAWMKSEGAS